MTTHPPDPETGDEPSLSLPPSPVTAHPSAKAPPRRAALRARFTPSLPGDPAPAQDEWLLSYADMSTLLLTVFVGLLLTATFAPSPDPGLVGRAGGRGAGEASAPGTPAAEKGAATTEGAAGARRFIEGLLQLPVVSPYDGGQAVGLTVTPGASGIAPAIAPPAATGPGEGATLAVVKDDDVERIRRREEVLRTVRTRLAEAGLATYIGVSVEADGVRLQIPNSILFATGAADLQGLGPKVVRALTPILAAGGFTVSVEGHTDSAPIATARFPSNWELSAQRAATVVRVLVEAGLDPTRIEAVGYADSRPLADNATEDGRRENRRVTLMLRLER